MFLGLASCTGSKETEVSTTETAPTETATTEANNSASTTSVADASSPGGGAMDIQELKIEDEVVGKGAEAKAGMQVTVHYTGKLLNGTKFDSSVDRNEPFTFALGAGMVIQGWDKGVAGMKVGGKRKLSIPSTMGYGAQGAGGVIPPNAGLVFDVELIKVK